MDIAKIRKKAKGQGTVHGAVPKVPSETTEETMQTSDADQTPAETECVSNEALDSASEGRKTDEPESTVVTAESQPLSEDSERIELLTFFVGAEEFAFKVDEVEEILRLQKITYVPTLPDYVDGITSLRGKIIPVIALKYRLGLKSGQQSEDVYDKSAIRQDAKILIISGPKGVIGALVDKVLGVVGITRDSIIDPPAHLTEAELKYIEGVVVLDKRFIAVIRAEEAMNIEL